MTNIDLAQELSLISLKLLNKKEALKGTTETYSLLYTNALELIMTENIVINERYIILLDRLIPITNNLPMKYPSLDILKLVFDSYVKIVNIMDNSNNQNVFDVIP